MGFIAVLITSVLHRGRPESKSLGWELSLVAGCGRFWGRRPRLARRVLQGLRVPQKSAERTPRLLGLRYTKTGELWRLVRNAMAASGRGVVVSRRGIGGAGRHH